MPVLLGHDEAVREWAARKLGHEFMPPASIIGWINAVGRLKAAALFFGMFERGNIDVAFAIEPPLVRGFVETVFVYAFGQMQCARITARPLKSNLSAIGQLKRAGFKHEATLKYYYGSEDAEQFRLLAHECKVTPRCQPLKHPTR